MSTLICTLRRFDSDKAVYIDRPLCIPEGYDIVTLAHEGAGFRTIFYGKF